MKRAFTLIEIIFVLVIVGILASLGSEILFNAYSNYLLAKTESRNQYKLNLALDYINKQLERSIPLSCIARKDSSGSDFNKIKTLQSLLPTDNYKVMECYEQAADAFKGIYDSTAKSILPGWSGFIDLYSPKTDKTQKTLHTLGSRLSNAQQIIYTLSQGTCNLNNANSNVGLIFLALPQGGGMLEALGWKYDPTKLQVYEVSKKEEDVFKVNGDFPDRGYERYYLSWTAMALVPEYDASSGFYNLYMYYNYRPWKGETFKDGERYLLIDHLSVFKFRQPGTQINLKLCVTHPILEHNITLCSERIVY